ncbi:carboxypeptidase regulatory-like domain-containing protein [Candidatus Amarolinea aalborgensis]|uniref:carboxypeptidase regulatory-like domain-containing protein n=1 Tax=Candidatus Amarolinea aalborgensis TaxID=2249329 RepID=UPI003BF977A4
MLHLFSTQPVVSAPCSFVRARRHLLFFPLAIGLLFILLLSMTPSATHAASPNQPPAPGAFQPEVLLSVKNDTSAPLSQLAHVTKTSHKLAEQPWFPLPKAARSAKNRAAAAEVAVQAPSADGGHLPGPLLSFEGMGNVDGLLPPDTNGDVGPNHYVQFINVSFAIYNKSGDLLFGPANEATLFQGFGTGCELYDSGDPLALYDHLADRWLLSFMAWPSSLPGDVYQCIAVSQSGDPLGAWHRYAFLVKRDKFNDYPKLGVWPDAYYMTANLFTSSSFAGAGVWAFERMQMLQGLPARLVHFDLAGVNPNFGGILPADLDGPPPPTGAPGYFAEVDDETWIAEQDALRLWEFHVDWATPANSTFGQAGQPNLILPTAPWSPLPCVGVTRNCIPQPGVSSDAYLDAIGDRLMHRLVYRFWGDHATLLANHTVDAGGSRAGIRWYELRLTGRAWSIYQQGTYAGDWSGSTAHRWMASMAMDGRGNLAIGYTASSPTVYPSVRYIGRRVEDPLNTLPRLETSFMEGSGSQVSSSSRWGDYSMMSVDPADDCTLWYTSEYYPTTADYDWHTRIGAFRFAGCVTPPHGALAGVVTDAATTQPISGALVSLSGYVAFSGADGHYQFAHLPAGSYTAQVKVYGYADSTANIAINDGAAATLDIALTPLPTTTMEGRVKDGSRRQRQPLYARLRFSAAGFTRTVFSDPQTGHYEVNLLQGVAYQITVNAVSGGYQEVTHVFTPTEDRVTYIFFLPEDGTCSALGYQREFVYFEDFEHGAGGYTTQGETSWAWGQPTSGPRSAHSGVKVWATNPGGSYSNNEDGYVVSPDIDLSAHADSAIIVSWWQYLQTERSYDLARVAVSNDGGATWNKVYGEVSGPVDLAWTNRTVTLGSDYAVRNFRIRFIFHSDNSVTAPGWYLDDIGIGAVPLPPVTTLYSETFESGNGGFTKTSVSDASSWAWGAPTNGPGRAHSGSKVWATNLSGSYADFEDGYIVSPPVDLSRLAGRSARLTWWQWLQTEVCCDFAALGVSKDNGASWTRVYGPVSGSVNVTGWGKKTVDLDPSFSVSNFRFRFRLWADYSVVAPGWYVDDVTIQNATPPPTLPCTSAPGSIVTGNVRDANTHAGITGATVRNETSNMIVTSAATPADPALDDGFYTLFAAPGQTCFLATTVGAYGSDRVCLDIPDDRVLAQDFHLPAGYLHVAPLEINVEAAAGAPLSFTLSLSNTGALSLTYQLLPINMPLASSSSADDARPFQRPSLPANVLPSDEPTSASVRPPVPPDVPILGGGRIVQSWPTHLSFGWGVGFNTDANDLWLSNIGSVGGLNRDYRFLRNGAVTGDSIDVSDWVGSFAGDMAYNSLSDRLWQVNVGGDNCLHELDPAAKISTGRRICPQLATSQRGLAYDPIADLYYVGGWNDLSIHLVSPNGRVMRSIVTELATSGLAYNPVTGHLFVLTNANAGLDVYVLDTTANFAVIGGFNLAGMTDFSQAGMDMDCSGHLWAVNQVTQRVLEIESGESDACSWMQIPWLTTSVLSGTIEAASSQAVVLTFDTNLAPGVYRAQLRVRHSAPYDAISIPIRLNIIAGPLGDKPGARQAD